MYDNYSTNDAVEVAKKLGFEIRNFGVEGELNDLEYLKVKNHCWKEARGEADYVIVCDVDEFIYHHQIVEMLALCKKKGITFPLMEGYDMYSDKLPKESIFEIDTGVYSKKYGKQIIFDPNAIEEIDYEPGCHVNHAKGRIKKGGYFKMLHYRHIGGEVAAGQRHRNYQERLSSFNKTTKYGAEYRLEEEEVIKRWRESYTNSSIVDFRKYPKSFVNTFKGIKPSDVK